MTTDPEFLLTADEAYPAFERAVLAARKEVAISMRVFDPGTPLISKEAQAVGRTWSDLIRHKLDQGVRFEIVISDFDPVARPDLHRHSWESLADLNAAAHASSNPELLNVDVHMHPARVSWGHRIMLMLMTFGKIRAECARLNGLEEEERAAQLATMPGFERLVWSSGGKIKPRIWPPASLVPATHHQKMAVVDGEWLYIGGLDLNPRRYDDKDHKRDQGETWHDIQVVTRGPVAAVAREHMSRFRDTTDGAEASPFEGLLRTLSAAYPRGQRRLAPRHVLNELEDAQIRLIGGAKRLIYIETQFLRSTTICDALVAAADRGVELIVMLPAAPEDVAFGGSRDLDARMGEQLQSKAVKRLRAAYGDRCFFGSPAQPRRLDTPGRDTHYGAPIIYIHAKVMVVDEESALVSSANLNGRSMRWDTETGLEFKGGDAARLFHRCVTHWFCNAPPEPIGKATTWTQAAKTAVNEAPDGRKHFVLPYDITPAEEMGKPVPGVPEEMV